LESTKKEGEKQAEEGDETEQEEEYIDVDAPAGTLVLIHGSVLHKSERTTSAHSRIAYTFHFVEGTHRYDARNWLQPSAAAAPAPAATAHADDAAGAAVQGGAAVAAEESGPLGFTRLYDLVHVGMVPGRV
jgi:ectoine hydroxylase-related dioxygenase (phytanoyl-CoA dioxygenase family)